MATSGALADFGRMPTNRKVLLFAAIAGVLGLFYWRFVYQGLAESAKKAEGAFKAAEQKNRQLEADLPLFADLRKKKGALDEHFVALQKALPTEAEVPAFFERIERKLTDAGIDDMKFSKKQEEQFDQFVKVPLQVEITGTFMQIKRFFASLVEKKRADAEPERIVSIENLSLTAPTLRNRDTVLTARFTAVTFRQAEVAPPPVQPGQMPANAPAPAAAGSNAPPGGSPPLPSYDSPQGVKQRVDGAMEKAREDREQRVRENTEGPQKTLLDGSGSARLKGGL